MNDFADWGYKKIDPSHPDVSWIDDSEVYPKTSIYRDQYSFFNETAKGLGLEIKSYLSLGTGLGRHAVLAHEAFENLKKIVTTDYHITPHATVQALSSFREHLVGPVKNIIAELAEIEEKFDFVCFENIGHNHDINTETAVGNLLKLLNPGALLAIIGDTKFDVEVLRASGELIKGPSLGDGWADTTIDNLWLKI